MIQREIKHSVSTDTFVRFWLVILGFLAVIGIIWWARSPLMLIATAFFLALILNRPVSFIARHLPGRSRALATFIAYAIILGLVATIFMTVVPIIMNQLYNFISSLSSDHLQSQSSWLYNLLAHYHLEGQVNGVVDALKSQVGGTLAAMGTSALPVITSTLSMLCDFFLVIFMTYFMLVEAPSWESRAWEILYHDPRKRRQHKIMAKRMYDVFSNYVTGQAIVGVISGTFTAVLVVILTLCFPDVPITLALPAWVTIFTVVFVPMFGALIGGSIVTLLLAVYSVPACLIYVVVFAIEQQVENNMIAPRIQAGRLDMSALLILIAMTIGMGVGGILGTLIAIPIAGCVIIVLRSVLHTRAMAIAATKGAGYDRNLDGIISDSEPVVFTRSR